MKKLLITLIILVSCYSPSVKACNELDILSRDCVEYSFTVPVPPESMDKVLELRAKYGDGWLTTIIDFFYSIMI